MLKSSSPALGWMPWSIEAGIEYQIADGFLRIREWRDGKLQISAWQKWERSTDATIRQLQRAIAWNALPKHSKHTPAPERRAKLRDHVRSWLRDHLIPS